MLTYGSNVNVINKVAREDGVLNTHLLHLFRETVFLILDAEISELDMLKLEMKPKLSLDR